MMRSQCIPMVKAPWGSGDPGLDHGQYPRIYPHQGSGQTENCLSGLVSYARDIAAAPQMKRFGSEQQLLAWIWAQPVLLDEGDGPQRSGCTPTQRSRIWPQQGLNCWEATAHFLAWHIHARTPIEVHLYDAPVEGQRHVFPAVRPITCVGETPRPEPIVLQPPLQSGRSGVRLRAMAQAFYAPEGPSRTGPLGTTLAWAVAGPLEIPEVWAAGNVSTYTPSGESWVVEFPGYGQDRRVVYRVEQVPPGAPLARGALFVADQPSQVSGRIWVITPSYEAARLEAERVTAQERQRERLAAQRERAKLQEEADRREEAQQRAREAQDRAAAQQRYQSDLQSWQAKWDALARGARGQGLEDPPPWWTWLDPSGYSQTRALIEKTRALIEEPERAAEAERQAREAERKAREEGERADAEDRLRQRLAARREAERRKAEQEKREEEQLRAKEAQDRVVAQQRYQNDLRSWQKQWEDRARWLVEEGRAQAWYNDLLGVVHTAGGVVLSAFGLGGLADKMAAWEGDALPDQYRTEAQRQARIAQAEAEAAQKEAEVAQKSSAVTSLGDTVWDDRPSARRRMRRS